MSKRPTNSKKDLSPEVRNRAALILINTVLLTFIYFGSQNINQPSLSIIVTAAYWLILAVFALIYVVYNRAFSRKGITVEMLPDTWSHEKKLEYVEDAKRRLERSKWML